MIMLLFCFLIAAFSFLQPTCGELFWNVRDPFKADLFTIESRSNRTNSQLHDNSLNFYLSNNSINVLANLNAVQAGKIDRRAEENWWNLYPFGEKFHDIDMTDQPWKDLQIDLDFYFPFYGFRFNYSFIYPEGFVAFSYPEYVQPPYSFPNPLWPLQHDPSFIAAFLSDQSFVHVGETQISHVWYRIVTRPQYRWKLATLDAQERAGLLSQPGRVEDPALLDAITRDIRENMVGTIGYTADYALIVTWERMGYGGQPKYLKLNEYDQIKKWQNTYQLVLTTDEHRSFVVFNYANINHTSSTSAGAFHGRGGRQSAIVGMNGGNGTGFYEFPYSAQGDSYKLAEFSSTQTKGRWLARVDEAIVYGGCSNASHGKLTTSDPWNGMIGGNSINVSGPCFRPNDYITMEIDEEIFDCAYISMVKARCIVPFNMIFKTGPVAIQIAQDGRSYSWYSSLYIHPPALTRTEVRLLSHTDKIDPSTHRNYWHLSDIENLTITWTAANISSKAGSRVDIVLWGYREDVIDREFLEVGAIARNIENTGKFSFNQKMLSKSLIVGNLWRKFWGGAIQIRLSKDDQTDYGKYVMWSGAVPFGWYFRDTWKANLGENWALKLCIEWYNYDGLRDNFLRNVYTNIPCPCTLSQALNDFGRFTPLPTCEMMGDSSCIYTKGAQHCIVSTNSMPDSGTEMCCYDYNGWLMFSQDYEQSTDYLRYFSAGVPYRANPWGGYVFKKPLYVPTWSNFYNDLLPYDVCCRWAGHCEFYYWRRATSGCQNYEPAVIGTAYGHGHFITFDGMKYSFSGRGYFVLTQLKTADRNLMIQIRMEQPPETMYGTHVAATVITGVAVKEDDSSVVQVFSRKQFRRWRYRTDVFVDGQRHFFDLDRRRFFGRVLVYVPHLVMNQSEVYIQLTSGVGVKVIESRGILQVIVALPPNYKQRKMNSESAACTKRYVTMGLLGTYNGDVKDEFIASDCSKIHITQSRSEENSRTIHHQFGMKWDVNRAHVSNLFGSKPEPLYYPNLFYQQNFSPVFDPWTFTNFTPLEVLIFSREQEVQVTCQGVYSCMYDYLVSGRREFALDTLSSEKKFEYDKLKGEQKTVSCGPLEKNFGVIKYPLGNNYLDGVTVTFTCQTEYFIHGNEQRHCINGSWSPGWWAWCRSRTEEIALKWMTGIVVSLAFILVLTFTFLQLQRIRKRNLALRHKLNLGITSSANLPNNVKSEKSTHSVQQQPNNYKPKYIKRWNPNRFFM
ncbi:Uncharacterized protein T01_9211 [Trichinella spiralis]|uniref:Protein mesh n=2 Tax=Trichinella spiralis TaxID=6334 RepID=A0A0V1BI12_TRISP|nr:Uncharacterized protein T01_9211 [Trichinella spiralis]